jgi:hypothetical protein
VKPEQVAEDQTQNDQTQNDQTQQDRQQQTAEVEIGALLTADSPRSGGEDLEHVKALAALQTRLPPIIVQRTTMRVIDGMHRIRAAELRGEHMIAVKFFDGTEADAFVLAVKANIAHGLPLTTTDRKRAAQRIITSHPHWSDRMIAAATGLAPGTVAALRRRGAGGPGAAADGANGANGMAGIGGAEGTAGAVDPMATRIGQDGRVRPINIAEGRRRAGQLITENPGLSLRQIAQAAGISPETARDVRKRLSRGDDPLPPPRQGRRKVRDDDAPPAFGAGGTAGAPAIAQAPARDRAAVVERLKADPALRFSETGRTLLRLLHIHTITTEEWDKIVANVPPHCSAIVAHLAGECSRVWAELATRLERNMAKVG